MRNPLSKKIVDIKPSGIRKFFDIVTEMNDPEVISLGVGEPDFDTPWRYHEMKVSMPLNAAGHFIHQYSGLMELRELKSAHIWHARCQVTYDPK